MLPGSDTGREHRYTPGPGRLPWPQFLRHTTHDDARLRNMQRTIVKTAQHHDAQTRYLRHTVPGIGQIVSLGLLYDIHSGRRIPSGSLCASLREATPPQPPRVARPGWPWPPYAASVSFKSTAHARKIHDEISHPQACVLPDVQGGLGRSANKRVAVV